MKKRVLVIVVTFNPRQWIDRCFGSLVKLSYPVDAFVIDNNSNDGSIEIIKERFPMIKVHESKENLGFGRANNIGLKYAIDNNYDYVYLLNQDAWIDSDTISTLLLVAENNHEYGILSPLQLRNDEETYEDLFYQYVICSNKLQSSFHKHLLNGDSLNDVYSVDFVMAAHWLISMECLKKIGGFSSTFYHYGEDNNYLQRAQFHGFLIGIVPKAKAVHDCGSRPANYSKKYINYRIYNRELVFSSNPNSQYDLNGAIKGLLLQSLLSKDFGLAKYAIRLYKQKKMIREARELSIKGFCFL